MSQTGRASHGSGSPEGIPAGIVWDSLTLDCSVAVYVLNGDGVIEYVNGVGSDMLGVESSRAVGRSFAEFFAVGGMGEERLGFIRDVAATGEVFVYDHTCQGRRCRTTLRAFERVGRPGRSVLMVCRYASGATGPGIAQAQHNDMGELAVLTPREVDILRMIGEGLTTSQIASELKRSEKTVEWHRVALGTKLGVANRVELARIAIRTGLVSVDHKPSTPAKGG